MTLKIYNCVSVAVLTLGLAACSEEDGPASIPSDTVEVMPVAETVPVVGKGNAADDPVIWANPNDPSKSLVIATDKKTGLVVYNLSGAIVYQNADGRMNNVDLRAGYPITTDNGNPATATPTVIVAATNRSNGTIAVYKMNPETGVLTDVMAEPIPSNFEDLYGLCLYRSAVNGKLYVYANDKDGTVSQWQLYDNGLGQLRGTIQRTWSVGSQTEGCVADDANGVVYIGSDYPSGLLVVQDGDNKNADGTDANQNFKYISWADVAEALNLD